MRNQLESVTRPEMTNKFTMREMIEETLAVYQGLHDAAIAKEQAEINAAADRKLKRRLKKSSQATRESTVSDVSFDQRALNLNRKNANVKLLQETPKVAETTKAITDAETVQEDKDL